MPSSTHRRTHAPRAWTIFSSSDSIFSSSDSRVLTHRTREFSLEFSRLCVRCERERERERERKRERERERERETPLCLPCLASTAFARPPLSVFVLFRWLCKTASSVSNTRCLSHAAKHLVFVARSQTRRERLELGLACLVVLVASFELCRAVFVARRETLATLSLLFLAVFVAPGQTLRDLLVFS